MTLVQLEALHMAHSSFKPDAIEAVADTLEKLSRGRIADDAGRYVRNAASLRRRAQKIRAGEIVVPPEVSTSESQATAYDDCTCCRQWRKVEEQSRPSEEAPPLLGPRVRMGGIILARAS
jgi:hypothetical protein